VGKTTTVAKLAADFALRKRLRVGLVTIDTYRIAAVDQLRTYAEIIGVPLEVVMTPAEMRPALERLSGCDVVLIDTAGRSQTDEIRIQELKYFLAEARPHEVHLVLSLTTGEKVIERATSSFAALGADRVIFTKLDEAAAVGMMLNCLHKAGLRLSYVTRGQDVPDDIEVGAARRIAELLCGAPVPAEARRS
jgi:flagellar biosynthesis protein FlhF